MNSQIKFNVANIKLCTEVEGPFKRCCIWFQGCNLHCKGCCNKELQSMTPRHIISLKELVNIVMQAKQQFDIEGITLSGGEPSLQNNLKYFNDEIHKLGLGIIMFSGKSKNEIDEELVTSVDLLIDGPFIENEVDNSRVLLGSKNKELSFITDRYRDASKYFSNPISIEEITTGDYIFINGD